MLERSPVQPAEEWAIHDYEDFGAYDLQSMSASRTLLASPEGSHCTALNLLTGHTKPAPQTTPWRPSPMPTAEATTPLKTCPSSTSMPVASSCMNQGSRKTRLLKQQQKLLEAHYDDAIPLTLMKS